MKKSPLLIGATLFVALALIAGCSQTTTEKNPPTSGAISGIMTIDSLISQTSTDATVRQAALLGLYVAEYLTHVPTAMAADSALLGIGAQMQIYMSQTTIQDPDYQILQAFGDALQVDVPDLLNRSTDRQLALETYTVALTNVAERSNDRYKELTRALDETKELAREHSKERSTADRDLQQALRDKNFSEAAEKQKTLNDLQAKFAETDLKQKQLTDLVDTFETLLELYEKKIVAIEKNREALIAGIKVVDIPGIEELDVLEKQRSPRRSGSDFDSLFTDAIL